MTETRRKYTKRQKLTAVLAADMTSQEAAAIATGIPRTTLLHWLKDPEMVELRQNARALMAEEALVVARMAWGKLADAIRHDRLDTDQLLTAVGLATDKAQLLGGAATTRAEVRDISGSLDDHERAALSDFLDGVLAEAAAASVESDPVGAGAGVRE